MRTAEITIDNIKDSDGWYALATELGYSEKGIYDIFEYGEYGSITIKVDENLNIIGGKINKHKD